MLSHESKSTPIIKKCKSRRSDGTCRNNRPYNEDRYDFSTIELPDVLSDQQWTHVLVKAVEKLQLEIDELELKGGSTLCAVIAHESTLRIVNVGDSGAHLVILDKASGKSVPITIRNGQIEYDANSKSHGLLLHKLHKPEISTEDLKKELKCNSDDISDILGALVQSGIERQYPETCAVIKGGGRVVRDKQGALRINDGLAMSRALGDKETFDQFRDQKNSIFHKPDVTTLKFNWSTFPKAAECYCAHIIAATDGLTDALTEDKVAKQMVESYNKKQDFAQNLITDAVNKGSIDNITVVVGTSGDPKDTEHYKKAQMFMVADGHCGESPAEHTEKNFFKHVIHFLTIACQETIKNRMRFIAQFSKLMQEDLKYMSDEIAALLDTMLAYAESKTDERKIPILLDIFTEWKSNNYFPIFLTIFVNRYSFIFDVLNEGQFAGTKFEAAVSQMQKLVEESPTFYEKLKKQCAGLFKEGIASLKLKRENPEVQHNENKKDDKQNPNCFKFSRLPLSTKVGTASSAENPRRITI